MALLLNKLSAVIVSQRHSGGLASIETSCGGYPFRLLVFENQKTREDGDETYLIIKESEIAISKTNPTDISISNRIECQIVDIKKGEILCEIELGFNSQKLVSMITVDSANRLELSVGDNVYALIKANEIYLESI